MANHKKFYLLGIILTLFFSCSIKESKVKKSEIKKNIINSYKTSDTGLTNFILNNKNDLKISHYENENNNLFLEIRSDGIVREKRSLNYFNELEKYYFDENNSLSEIRRYIKSDNNKYVIQDLLRYNNCLIDEKNSNYIDANIIEEKNDKVLIEFKYISGHKFYSGDLYFGREIYPKNENNARRNLKLIKLKNQSEKIWIDKKDIIFQNLYLEFYILIHRDVKSGIHGVKTHILRKEVKEFTQFFIVRRLLKSPMRE
jgi:hypothetical protein